MATFRKVKNVTLPLFKLATKQAYYFKFTAPMALGKIVDDKKEPPMMADVINLETGEEGQIILGRVLIDSLNEAYPDNGYVGRSFEIVKTAPEGARKYSLWNIAEVEVEAEAAAPKKGKGDAQ